MCRGKPGKDFTYCSGNFTYCSVWGKIVYLLFGSGAKNIVKSLDIRCSSVQYYFAVLYTLVVHSNALGSQLHLFPKFPEIAHTPVVVRIEEERAYFGSQCVQIHLSKQLKNRLA